MAFFSLACAYNGAQIALCWEMLAESDSDFQGKPGCATLVRDPYPLIAEKAGNMWSMGLGKGLRFAAISMQIKYSVQSNEYALDLQFAS